MKHVLPLLILILVACKKDPKPEVNIYWGAGVSDVDGNNYKTVVINNQEWMAENLRTTKFCDGNPITQATQVSDISGAEGPIWTYYNFDASKNIPHGKLYNGYAALDASNPCPCGWRVPSVEDWEVLVEFLGGFDHAGDKLKFVDQQYNWGSEGKEHEYNFSLFSAYPSGHFVVVQSVGLFSFISSYNSAGLFSTTTPRNDNETYTMKINRGSSVVMPQYHNLQEPRSIRCIKN